MKTARSMVLAGLVILIGAGSVFAQDWPQWRGQNRDAKVPGFTAPQTWPKTLTLKWKVEVGPGDSSPLLVGDKVYIFSRKGDNEVVQCLNAATGKSIWGDEYPAITVTGPAARGHTGPRSTPAVAEGKIVTLGVGGVVTCLDAASGKRLWQKDEYPKVYPRFYTSSSPVIADGICITILGGPGNGAIVAFNLANGDVKWKWNGDGAGYSSPVVATIDGVKQVVAMTDKFVVGVAFADGKLLWQVPFAVTGMAYNAATPIVDGSTVIYTGQGRGTKAIKIEKKGDAFAATELWSSPIGTQFNTPVLKDGKLYGLSDKRNFFCLDAKDGKTVWSDSTARDTYGFVYDGGSVLLAMPSNTAELIVLKPGDKYEELAKIKLADTAAIASPVVSGKSVFVKDQNTLALLTIE